jgi:hypothetical protein
LTEAKPRPEPFRRTVTVAPEAATAVYSGADNAMVEAFLGHGEWSSVTLASATLASAAVEVVEDVEAESLEDPPQPANVAAIM